MDSVTDCNNSVEQQCQPEGSDSSVRPSLSQVKMSWGFRRSTIARREFMEEVGELNSSPPLVRKGRGRKNKAPQISPPIQDPQKATCSTRSVLDDLEWSAPSSPASEESKPASEASAGGSLDPSMWQDFGSAFHTAFSLLGGRDGLLMDMPEVAATHNLIEDTNDLETPLPEPLNANEIPDHLESVNDLEDFQLALETKEDQDDVVFCSQEEDSDEMTLLQIKQKQQASTERQEHTMARGGKGGRGRARAKGRGKGRGRGKSKGRGKGRGRAVELESNVAINKEDDESMVSISQGQQLQQLEEEEEQITNPPNCFDITLSPAHRSSLECIITESNLDQQRAGETLGQCDNAEYDQEEDKKVLVEDKDIDQYSILCNTVGYDSNALCCICRQKHNNRFMICCDCCQECFHGDCVGISEAVGREMAKEGQEYICSACTLRKQSQLQPEPQMSPPQCPTQNPSSSKDIEGREPQQTQSTLEMMEVGEVPSMRPDVVVKSETTSPLCIGPSCSKYALPDSVYCGSDCILQHAAVTIKSLSDPKVPKSKGRAQRKGTAARAPAKTQRACRMSKRLAAKTEGLQETNEEDSEQEEEASSLACNPSLTEVQATTEPSPKCNASDKDSERVAADDSKAVTPSEQPSEEALTDAAPTPSILSEPALPHKEAAPTPVVVTASDSPQGHPPKEAKVPMKTDVSQQCSSETNPCASPPTATKPNTALETQCQTTPATRLHETGAVMVKKTSYVIPKKLSGPQTLSSQVSASAPSQRSSSVPVTQNETRNLPVPPAPIPPSSRPSQPNNQVRQSIQRSLISILFKRVCDCEELEMSESDVGKLVTSIEMEMFNIFRNTDSKYMNKYRTIMFNLKDPKNKGLLYRVVHGEISPFRLVRMSQKDMQAIQPPELNAKETPEIKDAPALGISSLQKPEPVKLDLPSLIPARTDKTKSMPLQEQKKTVPVPILKTRASQSSREGSAVPDILTCMLKDTTAEHQKHLFDLKCKICTGQILAEELEEPAPKKKRVSEGKHDHSWRNTKEDDSPLRAPSDLLDLDSPCSVMSAHLTMGSPVFTIVESSASPTIQDSPASPTVDTPASPVMESPASPTSDDLQTTPKKSYTPVVIPAVSTVTITRRDPRTAASRYSAVTNSIAPLSETGHHKSGPYIPSKDIGSTLPSAPPVSLPPATLVPKSILMKPSSSADPRLYGTSSRNPPSESPDGGTAQFLAKQEILWKGFLNMLNIAKFVTKGYLVSGSGENLKVDLPDTIQIGGRILPETVWDYVAKLNTSVTKELCVIRFQPATDEEEVAYVSLFSYFSSRGRFGVVANNNRSIKDMYLFPLSAKESVPPMLQPLEGPGLEKNRPNLLLGLAIVQKTKRPGSLPVEVEEKRPKVSMSTDPMWIPKPPSLYGSDNLQVFQPYDPETPMTTTPPCSHPELPETTSVSTTSVTATQSTTNKTISDNTSSTASSNKTPLQTILKQLFPNKEPECNVSSVKSTTTTTVRSKKCPVSMVDPIVQQYGKKTTVKNLEEEDNEFDRPYDPEDEYDPAMGYSAVVPKSKDNIKKHIGELSENAESDVAYDPEDETIFEDIQNDSVSKTSLDPAQVAKSTSCPAQISPSVTPAPASTPAPTSNPPAITYSLPTGTVVVSAETLTEQQRMLEELNKQIEEQKRQLKEQEEALRKQKEAVGMFMAHFSVSDSLMSPPSATMPLSKLATLQSGTTQKVKACSLDSPGVDSMSEQNTFCSVSALKSDADTNNEKNETQEALKESDKYSSAGEIGDSDVAYDPEDESLFDEIQEGVFQESKSISRDSSLSKTGQSSYHSRKLKLSPKRRSNRERGRRQSPPRRSQRRSSSRSRRRREKDRHHRSERTSSRHRSRDRSERHGRNRKEHTSHRHLHGQRRSSSSQRNKHSVSLSPTRKREPSPSNQFLLKSETNDQVPAAQQKSSVENLHSCSCDNLSDVKIEIKESYISLIGQEQVYNSKIESDHTQTTLASQLEILMDGKLDSLIPLREIDPPTRDSPQSPDPEPQFVKPVVKSMDFINTEGNTNPETNTNDQIFEIKIENNPLSIRASATAETFTTSDLHVQGAQGKNMAHTNKHIRDYSSDPHKQNTGPAGPGPGTQRGEEALVAKSDVAKGLDAPKSHVTENFTKQEVGGCEESVINLCIDKTSSGPGLRKPKKDRWESRHDSPGFEKEAYGKSRLYPRGKDTNMGCVDVCIPERQSPGMADERQYPPRRHAENFRPYGANINQNAKQDLKNMHDDISNKHRTDRETPGLQGMHGPQLGRRLNQSQENISKRGPEDGSIFSPNAHCDMGTTRDQPYIGDPDIGAGSNPVEKTGGPDPEEFAQRERTGNQRDPNMQNVEPGRYSVGQNFTKPGLEISSLSTDRQKHDIQEDANFMGPNFRGTGPEMRGSAMDRPGPGIGETGGSHFMGQRPRGRGSFIEGSESNRRGYGGPSFGGQPPEGGDPHVKSSRAEMRGVRADCNEPWKNKGEPRGPDFSEDKSRGFPFDGPGPHRHEHRHRHRGPSFGTGDEQRGSSMEGAGPHRGVPGGSEFSRGNEQRDFSMEGSGPHRGRHEGPGLSRGDEQRDFSMEGTGPHRGRPGGPDCSRGNEQRDFSMQGPGPHKVGPGGTNFSRRNEQRDFSMEGTGPHRGRPGGPDFSRGNEQRDFPMEGPGPHKVGPGGPDFRRNEQRDLSMEGTGPHRGKPGGPDFSRGNEQRNFSMECPGPHRGTHGGPDFSRRDEQRGFSMEGPGPHRGGPDLNRGEEQRGFSMEGPGPRRDGPVRPDFRSGNEHSGLKNLSLGMDKSNSGSDFSMEGPRPHRGGLGGPHLTRGYEQRGLSMEDPGPHRGGPRGPDLSGGDEQRGSSMEGPGLHSGGPAESDFGGGEQGSYPIQGPGPQSGGPRGPIFTRGDERGSSMEGPGPLRGGRGRPGFRKAGPDGSGLHVADFHRPGFASVDPNNEEHGRRGPGGSNLRRQWPEEGIQGPEPGPLGETFRGQGQGKHGSSSGMRGAEKANFRDTFMSTPESGFSSAIESPGSHGGDFQGSLARGPDCRGPHIGTPGPEQPGLLLQNPELDKRGQKGPPFFDAGPIRPGLGIEGPGPVRRCADPGEWNTGPESTGFENNNFKGPGPARPPEINLRPGRPGPRGPGFRPGGETRGPETTNFRGMNSEGPQHDRRGSWEGGDFRGSGPTQESPNMEGPVHHTLGQNLNASRPQNERTGASNRRSVQTQDRAFGGPRGDPGDDCSMGDCRGPRPVDQEPGGWGPENEWNEPDIDRFEDWPDRPQFKMDRKPYTRERGCSRGFRRNHQDMSSSHRRPPQSRRSPCREGPAHREDQESSMIKGHGELEMMGHDRNLSVAGPKPGDVTFNSRRPNPDGLRTHKMGPDLISPRLGATGPEMHINDRSHPTTRPQGPSNPQSPPFNTATGPVPNTVGNFGPQNQQVVTPQRHKAALLPTPPEGPLHFPNRVSRHDSFNPDQKQTGHPKGMPWGRGRSRR